MALMKDIGERDFESTSCGEFQQAYDVNSERQIFNRETKCSMHIYIYFLCVVH